MSQHSVTLDDLCARVRRFVQERDWEQFHAPKNLSMSIAIESAELMECFQWETAGAPHVPDETDGAAAADELADVLIYCIAMANALGIQDLGAIVLDKLARSEQKYPATEFKGRFK